VIVGEGPDDLAIRDFIREQNLTDRVTLLTALQEPRAQFDAIDLFFLPTRADTFHHSILAAASSGVPTIAIGSGGVFGLVKQDSTGILVEDGNLEAMADAAASLLSNPARLTEMGAAARAHVEKEFPVGALIERTRAVYKRATEVAPR
jgi:mannosyltransferase